MSGPDPQQCNCFDGTVLIVHKNFRGEKTHTQPFINLSLGKAGPSTLESHIHANALKMQGSPNN